MTRRVRFRAHCAQRSHVSILGSTRNVIHFGQFEFWLISMFAMCMFHPDGNPLERIHAIAPSNLPPRVEIIAFAGYYFKK